MFWEVGHWMEQFFRDSDSRKRIGTVGQGLGQ